VCCCYLGCDILALCAQTHNHATSVAQRVAKFVNFDAKPFMFIAIYFRKVTLLL
jgi:hypothetical protein